MIKLLVFLVVVCAIAIISYTKISHQEPLRPLSIAVEQQDMANNLLLTGVVVNDQEVTITALIDGQIATIDAREGRQVAKGDVLARLDSELGEAMLMRARVQIGSDTQKVEAQRRDTERFRGLFQSKNVSRKVLDESEIALMSAESALEITKADAVVAELNVANATIKAPFDAIVTNQTAEAGQWVEAGTRLFVLVGTEGAVIEAYVDGGDLSKVTYGQNVRMKTDAWPGVVWESSLNWISPVIGQSDSPNAPPNSFAVRFPLGDDAPFLLFGQRIDVELETESREEVLTLPLSALIENDTNGYGVWVQDSQGKTTLRQITPGLLTIDQAEILDGLSEGDRVLSPQGVKLEEGAPVDPL